MSPPSGPAVTMATGRVLLCSLLLLSLQLGLSRGPGALGSLLVEGAFSSGPAAGEGTWRPQPGKDPQDPEGLPDSLLADPGLPSATLYPSQVPACAEPRPAHASCGACPCQWRTWAWATLQRRRSSSATVLAAVPEVPSPSTA